MTKRIGIHLGTAGGASNAIDRAHAIGANAVQIFSASPRMWRAPKPDPKQCALMREKRAQFDVGPLIVHTAYLINLCSQKEEVREKSVVAMHGEVERALALGAEGLVLHPGSWNGLTREEGLDLAAQGIAKSVEGLPWREHPEFSILIENTAGAQFSLGGNLEHLAELITRLRESAPINVCLDTCHAHVAGYDLVSESGYEETMQKVEATVGFATVKVWHCNFRRLLNDPRFAHAAFIAETPVDKPEDEARNVAALRSVVA
jgi:deoxyribonuclease-4